MEKSDIDQNEKLDCDKSFPDDSRPCCGLRTVIVPKEDDPLDITLRQLASSSHCQDNSLASTLNGDEIDEGETVEFQMGEKRACSSQAMETIFVKQVRQDSKAHGAGLRTGDRIVSINGVNVAGKTYAQVIRLIHGSSDSALTLMVIPKNEDILQMAYRTGSSDERTLEMPSQSTKLVSTCVVSLSPASARRGERFNHGPVSFSSSPERVQSQLLPEGVPSSSPSLRISVRINAPSTIKETGGTSREIVHPAAFKNTGHPGEQCTIGGSSFYPVTTFARKIKPEHGISPREHYFLRTGTCSQSEQYSSLKANNEHHQVFTNLHSVQGKSDLLSAAERVQQQSVVYDVKPKHATVDSVHSQSPKLTSYQEITLSKLSSVGASESALLASSVAVPSRALSQEASCSSSHFIQMGAASTAPPPPLLDSQSPQQGTVSSVIGGRHQMFVSSRPQSYESLFGRNRLPVSQTVDKNHALTCAASRSSSELVDSLLVKTIQPAAVYTSPVPAVEQPRINLVAERMKRFESVHTDAAEGVQHLRVSKPSVDESAAKRSCPQFGFDSVARRTTRFEQISSEDAHCRTSGASVAQGKKSEPPMNRAVVVGDSRRLWSPLLSSASSGQVPPSVTIPLYFRADLSLSNKRQTSPSLRRHEIVSQNCASDDFVSESSISCDASSLEKKIATHSSENQPSPKLPVRQLSSHQDKSEKTTDGACSVTVESFSQSTTRAMAATLGIRDQLFTGDMTDSLNTSASQNASGKSGNSNIKKFVAFFTDKPLKSTDPTAEKKPSAAEPLTSGSITNEGCLVCKAAVAEGKRASDRSWKPFWAVLKGHFLCLYKDRYSVTSEDQSVCIKSCSVEIASDYVKKRNVFQLTTASGSKFLFQADDAESMSNWVKAIQANSELKEIKETQDAVSATLGQNLQQNLPVEKTSPHVAPKTKKQPSRIIPPSKSPSSPLSKSGRSGFADKDAVEPSKGKEKTWKGKMVSRFVRNRSGSGTAVEMPDDQEVTGTFGVPLCDCLPSLFNEYVPLIVETCTKIVEDRGIENQGIYRVPGNSSAVNTLRDDLNKFPENVDADSEKLQDVNVVSSLLKLFLRKLPDSLITDELYEPVIAAYRLQNPEKKMLKLKKLLHELPEHNFETFRFLAQHLNRIASREEVNKMDARNLAIVFGPTLVRPQDDSMALMVKDMSDQCRVVEAIITNVDWFFGSWDEDVIVPVAEDNEPISSMNPELLAKAENRMNAPEMTRDTSARDLVSSIFHPRKKTRRKDKHRNAESIETEGESDVSFTDRTVDQDLDIQGIKMMLESGAVTGFSSLTVDSGPTTVGSNSLISAEVVDTVERKAALVASSDMSLKVASFGSSDEMKRYPTYQFGSTVPAVESENSRSRILRQHSETALGPSSLTEPGHDALCPCVHDESLVEHAQQQLRHLHLDSKALHHKHELEQVECEKRAVAKKRIEKEFNKIFQELELEEDDSVELQKFGLSSAVAADSGDNSSSVRSEMDRCKLAMYEDRLRFFTDFGEKKTFSPVFRHGDGGQIGSSSNVSPTPLTRRLSDQQSNSLKAEDNCLLRAVPMRAHSASPSVIGREPKYTFDLSEEVSDLCATTCQSSSFRKLDQPLATVSEIHSSTDVTSCHPHVFTKPLTFSTSKSSAKVSSTGSTCMTASCGTDSLTARSSLASSGDQLAKDSVFLEKSPTESEPVLPVSADSGFIPEIVASSIQDSTVQYQGRSVEASTDVIPCSQADVTATIANASEGCKSVCSQEEVVLLCGDGLSSKEAVLSASLINELQSETVLDVLSSKPRISGAVSKDDNAKSSLETTAPGDLKASEVNFPITDVLRDSCLVSLHNANQVDHPVGNYGDIISSERNAVEFYSGQVVCSDSSENLVLNTGVNLTGENELCLHATDFTEATSVSTDAATSDVLLSSSLPSKSEDGFTIKKEVTGVNNVSEKGCGNIALNVCAVSPSRVACFDEIQLGEVTNASVLRGCNGGRNSCAVSQHSSMLHPELVQPYTFPQATTPATKFPSNAPRLAFCGWFPQVSHCNTKELRRRHSVGGGPLQNSLPEIIQSCPSNPNFSQLESCDLSNVHPTTSLPMLPIP